MQMSRVKFDAREEGGRCFRGGLGPAARAPSGERETACGFASTSVEW